VRKDGLVRVSRLVVFAQLVELLGIGSTSTCFISFRTHSSLPETTFPSSINTYSRDHDIHGPAGPTAFWKTSDGFRDYEDESQPNTLYHQTTANVQYNGAEEGEDEEEILEEDEELFELNGVTASDLVTELQLSGQTTAAQLHDVLTQIVMGHLQQHQNHHLNHDHDNEEDNEEDEEEEQEGSPEGSGRSRETRQEEGQEEHVDA
jgi:hypothetical protein